MRTTTGTRDGGRRAGAHEEEPDLKWAVEWLVERRGQRQAAELLGVDRKTVALALPAETADGRDDPRSAEPHGQGGRPRGRGSHASGPDGVADQVAAGLGG